MNAPKIKTFVSSVSAQLKSTRSQIIQDLSKAGYDVSAMERFGAQPAVPLDVCLGEVRISDVAILLVGPRYGTVKFSGSVADLANETRHAELPWISIPTRHYQATPSGCITASV